MKMSLGFSAWDSLQVLSATETEDLFVIAGTTKNFVFSLDQITGRLLVQETLDSATTPVPILQAHDGANKYLMTVLGDTGLLVPVLDAGTPIANPTSGIWTFRIANNGNWDPVLT